MRGTLFKYNANPTDPLLKDRRNDKLCRGFVDPDFWSHEFPIWSVCGPYVRSSLKEGDVVFFSPCKESWEEAGLPDYICTGMLIVGKKLEKNKFLNMPEIVQGYKNNYKTSLNKHLVRDRVEAPKTEKIRDKNIIIGASGSNWFGKNNDILSDVLNRLHIDVDVSTRIIKKLTGDECQTLFNYYDRRF